MAAAAAEDLKRMVEFLQERFPEDAIQTIDLITDALNTLQEHPRIGHPLEAALVSS